MIIPQFIIGFIGIPLAAAAVYSLTVYRVSPISILIMVACFIDVLYSTYFALSSIISFGLGESFGNSPNCVVSQIISTTASIGGLWSIAAVSVLSYLKTFQGRRLTNTEASVISACIWIFSFLYSLLPFSDYSNYIFYYESSASCAVGWHKRSLFTFALSIVEVGLISLGLITMISSEALFFKKYYTLQKDRAREAILDVGVSTRTTSNKKMEDVLIARSLSQIATCLIFWLPRIIFVVYSTSSSTPGMELESLSIIAMLLKNGTYSALILYYETHTGKSFLKWVNSFFKPPPQRQSLVHHVTLRSPQQQLRIFNVASNAKTVKNLDIDVLESASGAASPKSISGVASSQNSKSVLPSSQ